MTMTITITDIADGQVCVTASSPSPLDEKSSAYLICKEMLEFLRQAGPNFDVIQPHAQPKLPPESCN